MPLSLDLSDPTKQPFALLTVPTASWITVALPSNDISFKHTAKQGGGVLDSAAEDKVVMVQGDDVTTPVDTADGIKAVWWPSESKTFRGADIRATSEGKHVVRMRAVGNSVLMHFIVGTLDMKGR